MVALSEIDLTVVAAYFILVMAFGLWAGRGERNATDYFLAGRALPWYLIGFSFFASNMSGASFVGLMGASYGHGFAGALRHTRRWTARIRCTGTGPARFLSDQWPSASEGALSQG